MERTVFLSVRLSPEVRNRVRAVAAAHGRTVQDLVGSLVAQFLAEQDRKPPALPAVLGRLRENEADLRQRGVTRLWIIGSVARGDARPDSSLDLAADFDPAARVSLTGLASLQANLTNLLGAPVNLIEWGNLHRMDRAFSEAVQAF